MLHHSATLTLLNTRVCCACEASPLRRYADFDRCFKRCAAPLASLHYRTKRRQAFTFRALSTMLAPWNLHLQGGRRPCALRHNRAKMACASRVRLFFGTCASLASWSQLWPALAGHGRSACCVRHAWILQLQTGQSINGFGVRCGPVRPATTKLEPPLCAVHTMTIWLGIAWTPHGAANTVSVADRQVLSFAMHRVSGSQYSVACIIIAIISEQQHARLGQAPALHRVVFICAQQHAGACKRPMTLTQPACLHCDCRDVLRIALILAPGRYTKRLSGGIARRQCLLTTLSACAWPNLKQHCLDT